MKTHSFSVTAAGAALAGLLAGCSADDGSNSTTSSCKIQGTYSFTQRRTAGSCGPLKGETDPGTLTFLVTGSDVQMSTQGITGTCPGTIDGCTVTIVCEYRSTDGAVVATENSSYKFTNGGFSGSAAIGLRPPAVPNVCTVDYAVTGVRK